MNDTYKIIRYIFDGEPITIKTGLTLEEAQKHCQSEKMHGKDWFDGYIKERK